MALLWQRAKALYKVLYDSNEWDWVNKSQINCHVPASKAAVRASRDGCCGHS